MRLDADRLDIANHGAVVPAERLAVLLRPFERGSPGSDGSELGLLLGLASAMAPRLGGVAGGGLAAVIVSFWL